MQFTRRHSRRQFGAPKAPQAQAANQPWPRIAAGRPAHCGHSLPHRPKPRPPPPNPMGAPAHWLHHREDTRRLARADWVRDSRNSRDSRLATYPGNFGKLGGELASGQRYLAAGLAAGLAQGLAAAGPRETSPRPRQYPRGRVSHPPRGGRRAGRNTNRDKRRRRATRDTGRRNPAAGRFPPRRPPARRRGNQPSR